MWFFKVSSPSLPSKKCLKGIEVFIIFLIIVFDISSNIKRESLGSVKTSQSFLDSKIYLFIYLTHDGPPILTKGVSRFERRIGDAP